MSAKIINLADRRRRPSTVFDYPYIARHLRRALRELVREGARVIKASMVAECAAQRIARGKRGIVCADAELQAFAAEMLDCTWGSQAPSRPVRFR